MRNLNDTTWTTWKEEALLDFLIAVNEGKIRRGAGVVGKRFGYEENDNKRYHSPESYRRFMHAQKNAQRAAYKLRQARA